MKRFIVWLSLCWYRFYYFSKFVCPKCGHVVKLHRVGDRKEGCTMCNYSGRLIPK
jgi:hypothetical protein